MIIKIQYTDQASRQSILDANTNKTLIEEDNITEGNFLVFSDQVIEGTDLQDVQSQKISQVKDLANQSLYTTVTSNGATYNYSIDSGYPAFQKLLLGMVAGIIVYPYTLYDINHIAVSFATINDLKLLYQDIAVRENAINTKVNDYITQIKACTTIDSVNAITIQF